MQVFRLGSKLSVYNLLLIIQLSCAYFLDLKKNVIRAQISKTAVGRSMVYVVIVVVVDVVITNTFIIFIIVRLRLSRDESYEDEWIHNHNVF